MSLHATTLRNLRGGRHPTAAPTVRVRIGREDWGIRQSHRERILGPEAPDWFALEREPRAQLIKSAHGRAIWRVILSTGTVFAKVARAGRLVDRTKWLLIASPGEREWNLLQEAERRRVPVARSLAIGVQDQTRPRSVLLTEGLNFALDLRAGWEQNVIGRPRRQRRIEAKLLIEAVSRLFAASHDSGFEHRDDHPDNILLTHDQAKGWVAAFVDVHSSRFTTRPLSPRRVAESMARLDQSFVRWASRAERLRFVRCYLEQRRMISGAPRDRQRRRELVVAATSARQRQHERLARQRDRRLRHQGKYFARVRLGRGWRAQVVLTLERRHVFPERDVPDRSPDDWRAILAPISEAISHNRPAEDLLACDGLEVEVRHPKNLGEWLSSMWGRTRQWKVFERCHQRRHRDEGADLILAYGECRRLGRVVATFLIRPGRSIGRERDRHDTERNDDRPD